ncbi:MAG TPA: YqgE/AlgH family protein [Acidobacteriota bacterium]|nr:YqgE/AlgH family protein [Acidobacteriota bacterium]
MLRRALVFGLLVLSFAMRAQPAESPFDESDIAAGKLLIASSYFMGDPKFQASVVLLVRHEPEKGTLGLILNHPTKMSVRDALPGISDVQHMSSTVYIGGPVAPQNFMMLVRTSQPADGLIRVVDNVSFSDSIDSIAEWLPKESRANRIRIFAGYSGWGAGQLAFEIRLRGWHLLPANAKEVFDISPENLWPELAKEAPGIRTSIGSGWPFLASNRSPFGR